MTGYTVTCDQPGRISINMGDIQYDILDLASAGKLNRELKKAIQTAWPGTRVSVDCFDDVERLCRVLSKLGYATPESKEAAAASSEQLVLTLIMAADDLCDRLSSNTEEPKKKNE